MSRYMFRCWDKFQNKYIFEGFHVIGEVTCFGGMELEISKTFKGRMEKYGYKHTLDSWNDFEMEQFTGLKDKNGKDVYEGDILGWDNKTDDPDIGYDKVTFEDGGFKFGTEYLGELDLDSFYIVGNIHENLELIN